MKGTKMDKLANIIIGGFTLVSGLIVTAVTLSLTSIIYGALFYFIYNALSYKWLYFIPDNLKSVGFWESIGLFILAQLLGTLIAYMTPKIVSVKSK